MKEENIFIDYVASGDETPLRYIETWDGHRWVRQEGRSMRLGGSGTVDSGCRMVIEMPSDKDRR